MLSKENIYYHSFLPLSPGEYKCRIVIRNLETGKGAKASAAVIVPKSPDSGLRLFPPLLCKPEENALYLKGTTDKKKDGEGEYISLQNIYPIDYTQYTPIVDGLEQRITNLLAVVQCSVFDIQQPEIRLSAHVIHQSSGKKIPLSYSILNQYQDNDTQTYLLELHINMLEPGRYFLYVFAEEINTQSLSHVTSTFSVF